ncbi:hypothetical protein SALWKB29_0113 [Snodgrassella communis]|uniref:Uncharacterized protein n=1 Tax=Snodgrassella communis TaxID=2946699 RepID=A0A836MRZ9_9NEIS|nr:hypothetical protein SALWKB29_0113 [Snodgrassella communis]
MIPNTLFTRPNPLAKIHALSVPDKISYLTSINPAAIRYQSKQHTHLE